VCNAFENVSGLTRATMFKTPLLCAIVKETRADRRGVGPWE
jgi:hypothetical protein